MSKEIVIIHGSEWKKDYIKESVEHCRKLKLEKAIWKATPALIDKSGSKISQYVGQKFDPDKTEYSEKGWDHDHCEICWWELFETNDPSHGIGYKFENIWVCQECYEKFILTEQ